MCNKGITQFYLTPIHESYRVLSVSDGHYAMHITDTDTDIAVTDADIADIADTCASIPTNGHVLIS